MALLTGKYRNHKTIDHSPVSQLTEKRQRPRTCFACRASVSAGNAVQRGSVQSSSDVLLPRHSDSSKQKSQRKYKLEKMTDLERCGTGSRKVTSCQYCADASERDPTSSSSLSSRLHSRTSEPLEAKVPGLPVLQSRMTSKLLVGSLHVTSTEQGVLLSNAELRKWIVQFGGDEQAAFMARGLQKLQLGYERGKAEMREQANNGVNLPMEH
ncbi:uncharacterized protein LOC128497259 [Spea bombifrons]|uniref:uncharacterized protein LOC128497259 n=1 Tax=Spea bombifrons TaxID=233779 RepID=UPI00234972FC|nr:uncharacterized protein LOC128497259 [Spea bombifrons]